MRPRFNGVSGLPAPAPAGPAGGAGADPMNHLRVAAVRPLLYRIFLPSNETVRLFTPSITLSALRDVRSKRHNVVWASGPWRPGFSIRKMVPAFPAAKPP